MGEALVLHPIPQRGHPKVRKPYGWEETFVNAAYCGKRIYIRAGEMNTWHKHLLKSETFLVEYGTVGIRYAAEEKDPAGQVVLHTGDTLDIPAGVWHRCCAITDVYLIEFSTHHDDTDVVRGEQG